MHSFVFPNSQHLIKTLAISPHDQKSTPHFPMFVETSDILIALINFHLLKS